MNKSTLSLSMIAIILAGCDSVSERDCGVFDHPDLMLWQSDFTESQVQFMSADGSIRDFTMQAVVFNDPFRGTDGSRNDEDVVCELTASFSMRASDDSLAITTNYLQQELLVFDSDDETLLVNFEVEAPVGTELTGDYLADVTVGVTRLIVNPTRVVYLETEQSTEVIGGQSYVDVVRIDALEEVSTDEQGASIDEIQQIVIAREFGVVAFTDGQGQEFARLLP